MLLNCKHILNLQLTVAVYITQRIWGAFRSVAALRLIDAVLPYSVFPHHGADNFKAAGFAVFRNFSTAVIDNCRRDGPSVKACGNRTFIEFYNRLCNAGDFSLIIIRALDLHHFIAGIFHKLVAVFILGIAVNTAVVNPAFITGNIEIRNDLGVRIFFYNMISRGGCIICI